MYLKTAIKLDIFAHAANWTITLDTVFKNANNKLPLSWDGENLTIQPRIEPDMYPAPNTRLDLSNQKDAKQYKTYLQTVALSHKPQ